MPRSTKQLIESSIREAIQGSVSIVKPGVTNKLKIEPALARHAHIIAGWAKAGEPRWIGATKTKLAPEEVRTWIKESVGSYLLVDAEAGDLLAFANVALSQDDDFSRTEVGRLLVPPGKREHGFGSTLVRNLCAAITSAYKNTKELSSVSEKVTVSRVLADNPVGLQFIETLPFQAVEAGEDTEHIWYEYILDRRLPRLLGQRMEALRRLPELKMSQAQLAFLCGVQRETINMIESGRRTASLELLTSICRILGSRKRDQIEKAEILLAAIGEEREKSLGQYKTIYDEAPAGPNHLWIATDTMAESIADNYYEDTRDAIAKGFDRFYFMPTGKWVDEGEPLLQRLHSDLGAADKENLERTFRFYEIEPSWLCSFRIAVANPNGSDPGSNKITVGAKELRRVELSDDQSRDILRLLKRGVDDADNGREGTPKFIRCFPVSKKGQGR